MTTESKKLQTISSDMKPDAGDPRWIRATLQRLRHDARIAHELMDPARKTPETPLEHEQRDVIRQLAQALRKQLPETAKHWGSHQLCGCPHCVLETAAPFLED